MAIIKSTWTVEEVKQPVPPADQILLSLLFLSLCTSLLSPFLSSLTGILMCFAFLSSLFSSTLCTTLFSLFLAYSLSLLLCPSLSPYGGLGRLTAYSMLIGFIQTDGDHWAISNYPYSYLLLQICALTHFQSRSSLWIKHMVTQAVWCHHRLLWQILPPLFHNTKIHLSGNGTCLINADLDH